MGDGWVCECGILRMHSNFCAKVSQQGNAKAIKGLDIKNKSVSTQEKGVKTPSGWQNLPPGLQRCSQTVEDGESPKKSGGGGIIWKEAFGTRR